MLDTSSNNVIKSHQVLPGFWRLYIGEQPFDFYSGREDDFCMIFSIFYWLKICFQTLYL